jgi:transposase
MGFPDWPPGATLYLFLRQAWRERNSAGQCGDNTGRIIRPRKIHSLTQFSKEKTVDGFASLSGIKAIRHEILYRRTSSDRLKQMAVTAAARCFPPCRWPESPHRKLRGCKCQTRPFIQKTRCQGLKPSHKPVLPPKNNRISPQEYDQAMYRRHNEIERLFRRLKGFQLIFSRFDKLDVMFTAFIHFALIVEALS